MCDNKCPYLGFQEKQSPWQVLRRRLERRRIVGIQCAFAVAHPCVAARVVRYAGIPDHGPDNAEHTEDVKCLLPGVMSDYPARRQQPDNGAHGNAVVDPGDAAGTFIGARPARHHFVCRRKQGRFADSHANADGD